MHAVAEKDNGKLGMIVKRVSVPIGLEELMEGLTKEVLLKKPKDLYVFASEYFSRLVVLRDRSSKAYPIRTAQSVTHLKTPDIVKGKKITSTRPTRHLPRQTSIQSRSPTLPKLDQLERRRNVSQRSRDPKPITDKKDNAAKEVLTRRERSVSTNRKDSTPRSTSSIQSTPREKRQRSSSRSSVKDFKTVELNKPLIAEKKLRSERKSGVKSSNTTSKTEEVKEKLIVEETAHGAVKELLDSDILATITNVQEVSKLISEHNEKEIRSVIEVNTEKITKEVTQEIHTVEVISKEDTKIKQSVDKTETSTVGSHIPDTSNIESNEISVGLEKKEHDKEETKEIIEAKTSLDTDKVESVSDLHRKDEVQSQLSDENKGELNHEATSNLEFIDETNSNIQDTGNIAHIANLEGTKINVATENEKSGDLREILKLPEVVEVIDDKVETEAIIETKRDIEEDNNTGRIIETDAQKIVILENKQLDVDSTKSQTNYSSLTEQIVVRTDSSILEDTGENKADEEVSQKRDTHEDEHIKQSKSLIEQQSNEITNDKVVSDNIPDISKYLTEEKDEEQQKESAEQQEKPTSPTEEAVDHLNHNEKDNFENLVDIKIEQLGDSDEMLVVSISEPTGTPEELNKVQSSSRDQDASVVEVTVESKEELDMKEELPSTEITHKTQFFRENQELGAKEDDVMESEIKEDKLELVSQIAAINERADDPALVSETSDDISKPLKNNNDVTDRIISYNISQKELGRIDSPVKQFLNSFLSNEQQHVFKTNDADSNTDSDIKEEKSQVISQISDSNKTVDNSGLVSDTTVDTNKNDVTERIINNNVSERESGRVDSPIKQFLDSFLSKEQQHVFQTTDAVSNTDSEVKEDKSEVISQISDSVRRVDDSGFVSGTTEDTNKHLMSSNDESEKIISYNISQGNSGRIDSPVKQFLNTFLTNEQQHVFRLNDSSISGLNTKLSSKSTEEVTSTGLKESSKSIEVPMDDLAIQKTDKLPKESSLIFNSVKDLLEFDSTKTLVENKKSETLSIEEDHSSGGSNNLKLIIAEMDSSDGSTNNQSDETKSRELEPNVAGFRHKRSITGEEIEELSSFAETKSVEGNHLNNIASEVEQNVSIENVEPVSASEKKITDTNESKSINEESLSVESKVVVNGSEDASQSNNSHTIDTGSLTAEDMDKISDEAKSSSASLQELGGTVENEVSNEAPISAINENKENESDISDLRTSSGRKINSSVTSSENTDLLIGYEKLVSTDDSSSDGSSAKLKENVDDSVESQNEVSSVNNLNGERVAVEEEISLDNGENDIKNEELIKAANISSSINDTTEINKDTKNISKEDLVTRETCEIHEVLESSIVKQTEFESGKTDIPSLDSLEGTLILAEDKSEVKRKPKIGDIDQVATVIEVVKSIFDSKSSIDKSSATAVREYLNSFLQNEQGEVFRNGKDNDTAYHLKSSYSDESADNKVKSNNEKVADKTKKRSKLAFINKQERSLSQTNVLNKEKKGPSSNMNDAKVRRARSVGIMKIGDEAKTKIPTPARRSAGRRPLVRQLEADSKELEEKLNFKRSSSKGSKEDTKKTSSDNEKSAKSIKSKSQNENNSLKNSKELKLSKDDVQIAKTILKGVEGAEKHIELIEERLNKNNEDGVIHKDEVDLNASKSEVSVQENNDNIDLVNKESDKTAKAASALSTENKTKLIGSVEKVVTPDEGKESKPASLSEDVIPYENKPKLSEAKVDSKTIVDDKQDIWSSPEELLVQDDNGINFINKENDKIAKSKSAFDREKLRQEIEAVGNENQIEVSSEDKEQKSISISSIGDVMEKSDQSNQNPTAEKIAEDKYNIQSLTGTVLDQSSIDADNLVNKESDQAIKSESSFDAKKLREEIEAVIDETKSEVTEPVKGEIITADKLPRDGSGSNGKDSSLLLNGNAIEDVDKSGTKLIEEKFNEEKKQEDIQDGNSVREEVSAVEITNLLNKENDPLEPVFDDVSVQDKNGGNLIDKESELAVEEEQRNKSILTENNQSVIISKDVNKSGPRLSEEKMDEGNELEDKQDIAKASGEVLVQDSVYVMNGESDKTSKSESSCDAVDLSKETDAVPSENKPKAIQSTEKQVVDQDEVQGNEWVSKEKESSVLSSGDIKTDSILTDENINERKTLEDKQDIQSAPKEDLVDENLINTENDKLSKLESSFHAKNLVENDEAPNEHEIETPKSSEEKVINTDEVQRNILASGEKIGQEVDTLDKSQGREDVLRKSEKEDASDSDENSKKLDDAATTIQKTWKGFQVRTNLAKNTSDLDSVKADAISQSKDAEANNETGQIIGNLINENKVNDSKEEEKSIEMNGSEDLGRPNDVKEPEPTDKHIEILQKNATGIDMDSNTSNLEKAAIKIQSAWKGFVVRKILKNSNAQQKSLKSKQEEAIIKIQAIVRGFLERIKYDKLKSKRQNTMELRNTTEETNRSKSDSGRINRVVSSENLAGLDVKQEDSRFEIHKTDTQMTCVENIEHDGKEIRTFESEVILNKDDHDKDETKDKSSTVPGEISSNNLATNDTIHADVSESLKQVDDLSDDKASHKEKGTESTETKSNSLEVSSKILTEDAELKTVDNTKQNSFHDKIHSENKEVSHLSSGMDLSGVAGQINENSEAEPDGLDTINKTTLGHENTVTNNSESSNRKSEDEEMEKNNDKSNGALSHSQNDNTTQKEQSLHTESESSTELRGVTDMNENIDQNASSKTKSQIAEIETQDTKFVEDVNEKTNEPKVLSDDSKIEKKDATFETVTKQLNTKAELSINNENLNTQNLSNTTTNVGVKDDNENIYEDPVKDSDEGHSESSNANRDKQENINNEGNSISQLTENSNGVGDEKANDNSENIEANKHVNDKPDFYRSNTVVEPVVIKKSITHLTDDSNDLLQTQDPSVATARKDDNNNTNKDETDLEKDVRHAVQEILGSGNKMTPLEIEISQAVKNIMENNPGTENFNTLDESSGRKQTGTAERAPNLDKMMSVDTALKKLPQIPTEDIPETLTSTHTLNESNDTRSGLDKISEHEDNIPLLKTEEKRPSSSNLIKAKSLFAGGVHSESSENDENNVSLEMPADDLSSVGSVDSIVTVILKPKQETQNKQECDTHSKATQSDQDDVKIISRKLPNKAFSTSALEDHVELIDQVQNSLLDQLSGKTSNKFDIEQLHKELHGSGTLYKDEDDNTSLHEHDPEVLEYLYDFEPEDDSAYDSRVVRTPLRELPDIAEETESKEEEPDFVRKAFCGTPNCSIQKVIDGRPLSEHVETINSSKSNDTSTELIMNKDNIEINKESEKADKGQQKLLHTSELHDTVIIPVSGKPVQSLHNLLSTDLNSESLSDAGSLKHTSEFHDTVVVPLPSGADVNIKNASKTILPENVMGTSQANIMDSGNQTSIQQAPAGVEIVTSSRRRSQRDGVDDVEAAQASLKDTSPAKPESGGSFTHQSPPQSQQSPRSVERAMESENNNNKRNNAITNNVPAVEKNMEAEAATKIQAGFRGYQVRKQLKAKNAAIDQKRQLRKRSSRENMKDPELEEKSAVKIQAGVRGFLVRRRNKKQINSSASA